MRNSRFLVVDDSKIILSAVRNIITNRLAAEHVMLAKNGADALALLKEHKFDIIVCDWHMPKLDGLELLKEIRGHADLKDIPFIMMSTHGNKEDVVSAIQQGVNQYVVKPFSPEILEDAVRKAYNSAHKRAARRYSGIPKHTVRVNFETNDLEASAIDISRSGTLIRMTYDNCINLFGECELYLDFDEIDELAIINVGPLKGRVLRIESANGYHPSTKMCEIALCFLQGSDPEVADQMKQLIHFLSEKEKAALKSAL